MSVYQHWDSLKTCMVGRTYSPEFYAWIENKSARNAMEKIAQETEEDYQSLIKILKKFDVTVIRPEINNNHQDNFNTDYNVYNSPPMTPRDHIGVFNDIFIEKFKEDKDFFGKFYYNIKDKSWPDIKNISDFKKLPLEIINEITNSFDLAGEIQTNFQYSVRTPAIKSYYDAIKKHMPHKEIVQLSFSEDKRVFVANTASVTRVGKDLYFPNTGYVRPPNQITTDSNYRLNFYKGETHADSCFAPVVPGLILSLEDYQNYKETFPDWEVVYLKNQSWDKIKPFSDLKGKTKGKWWVPGQENNNALTEAVEQWLGHWVGYVEETVFDVNLLVINEKNVVVNNYNKQVFDALERFGVTPHICNFRHRYFWDGGLHCITADLDRKGEMKDYFPNRNYKTKEY